VVLLLLMLLLLVLLLRAAVEQIFVTSSSSSSSQSRIVVSNVWLLLFETATAPVKGKAHNRNYTELTATNPAPPPVPLVPKRHY